jgi:hypothetical protein
MPKENTMDKDNEQRPITRIVDDNGTVWYPRYHKNAKGEWELNDKSFLKMLRRYLISRSDKNAKI